MNKIVVAVGSTNPTKIEAVKIAFSKVWPDKNIEVIGVAVNSGVSSQPMTYTESVTGAKNRAQKAMQKTKADFAVGLEGGIQKIEGRFFDSGWIVILDKNGNEGIGSSVHGEVPPKMMKRIHEGLELGHVDDEFFNRKNSKQEEGHFGIMTKGAITRTDGYRDGVIMALVRFLHVDLFE